MVTNEDSPSKVEVPLAESSSNKGLQAFYWVTVMALLVAVGIVVYLLIGSQNEIKSLN